jgi:hypothetical protein
LFGFQSQFNEELLQLLVAIVDADLFKAVGGKDLKPVNVKQPHHSGSSCKFMREISAGN